MFVSYSGQPFIQEEMSNVDNQRTHAILHLKDDIQSDNSVNDLLNENNNKSSYFS